MIVVDASVLIAAEDGGDRHHEASAWTLEGEPLASVDLAWYEVINVAEAGEQGVEPEARGRTWSVLSLPLRSSRGTVILFPIWPDQVGRRDWTSAAGWCSQSGCAGGSVSALGTR